jgi:hypothetical protein
MQPAAVQKHIRGKRQIIAQRQRLAAVSRRLEVLCRDQGKAVQEQVEVARAQADLE